jgi:hypothetical protein
MTRSLRSKASWAGRHKHLNDEIAALDDAPELAPDKKDPVSFYGTIT